MDEKPDRPNQELYKNLNIKKLIECAENERIDEWNTLYLEYLESEWKRIYPKREWDPENILELVENDRLHLRQINYLETRKRVYRFKRPRFLMKTFREALSRGVSFKGAHLDGADFRRERLDGTEFKGVYLKGANFWEAYLEAAKYIKANLKGANFRMADLGVQTFKRQTRIR